MLGEVKEFKSDRPLSPALGQKEPENRTLQLRRQKAPENPTSSGPEALIPRV